MLFYFISSNAVIFWKLKSVKVRKGKMGKCESGKVGKLESWKVGKLENGKVGKEVIALSYSTFFGLSIRGKIRRNTMRHNKTNLDIKVFQTYV